MKGLFFYGREGAIGKTHDTYIVVWPFSLRAYGYKNVATWCNFHRIRDARYPHQLRWSHSGDGWLNQRTVKRQLPKNYRISRFNVAQCPWLCCPVRLVEAARQENNDEYRPSCPPKLYADREIIILLTMSAFHYSLRELWVTGCKALLRSVFKPSRLSSSARHEVAEAAEALPRCFWVRMWPILFSLRVQKGEEAADRAKAKCRVYAPWRNHSRHEYLRSIDQMSQLPRITRRRCEYFSDFYSIIFHDISTLFTEISLLST